METHKIDAQRLLSDCTSLTEILNRMVEYIGKWNLCRIEYCTNYREDRWYLEVSVGLDMWVSVYSQLKQDSSLVLDASYELWSGGTEHRWSTCFLQMSLFDGCVLFRSAPSKRDVYKRYPELLSQLKECEG